MTASPPAARRNDEIDAGVIAEQQLLEGRSGAAGKSRPLRDGNENRRFGTASSNQLRPLPKARFEELAEASLASRTAQDFMACSPAVTSQTAGNLGFSPAESNRAAAHH